MNLDRFYVQGFTSIAVPTDSVVVTALFNDIGVGYYLYRGDGERFITALIPTVEAHVTQILLKLGLAESRDQHRRVLAVLTFLRA